MDIYSGIHALGGGGCQTFPGLFYQGSELTLIPGGLKYFHVSIRVGGIHESNNQCSLGHNSS